MPIAFPPQDRGPEWTWSQNVAQRHQASGNYDTKNLARFGTEIDSSCLDPGWRFDHEYTGQGVNLRNLGRMYEHIDRAGRGPEYSTQPPQDGVWVQQNDWADSNRALIGVSRDASGTILANCVVQCFETGSRQLREEVTSDGSGVFQFGNPGTGPFFIRAYKTGSPDLAGTTVDTLFPTAV